MPPTPQGPFKGKNKEIREGRFRDRMGPKPHRPLLAAFFDPGSLGFVRFIPKLSEQTNSQPERTHLMPFSLIFTNFPGTVGPWVPGTLVLWDPGTVGPWDRGTLGPWDPGTLGPWDPGTLGPWDPGTLGPWEPGTLGRWDRRPTFLNS